MHCGFISAAFTSYARYMRYFFVAVTAILCFGLVLFGPQAAAGAADGFELFISCVFPSLFPFFVCVALLKGLGVFGVKSGRAGAAIFKIFAVSLISGTPTGPMLIGSVLPENTELNYNKQQLNNELRSALAALTNLASPVFIAGAVCSRMFGFRERKAALLLAFSHYGAAALSVGLLMLLASALNCKFRPAADSQSRIRAAAVFPKAVRESVNSILLVGGTLVFFVVAVRLLEASGIVSLLGLNELQKRHAVRTFGNDKRDKNPFGGACVVAFSRSHLRTYVFRGTLHISSDLRSCESAPCRVFRGKAFPCASFGGSLCGNVPVVFFKRRTGIHFDGGICGHCRKHNDDCTNCTAMPVFLLHIRTRGRVCRQKHEDLN